MNTKEAITTVRDTVTNCGPEKFQDIETILTLGAGNIFLEERTAESRLNGVLIELIDAIHYSTCGDGDEYQPEAPFIPVFSGSWELVLASLIIDQDWQRISKTAQELREEHVQEGQP